MNEFNSGALGTGALNTGMFRSGLFRIGAFGTVEHYMLGNLALEY